MRGSNGEGDSSLAAPEGLAAAAAAEPAAAELLLAARCGAGGGAAAEPAAAPLATGVAEAEEEEAEAAAPEGARGVAPNDRRIGTAVAANSEGGSVAVTNSVK